MPGSAPEALSRLRAFFDTAAVGMGVREVDGRWLEVNDRLCEMLGYTRAELLATSSVDLTPPGERALSVDFNRRIAGGELVSYSREKRYLRRDGRPLWVNVTITAIEGGRRVVSVIQDVSARRAAEEEALRAEERLRSGLENLGEMIVLTDAEDRIVIANRRFLEFNAPVAAHARPGCHYSEHLRAGIALGLFPDARGREEAWLAERMRIRHVRAGPQERRRQDGRWLLVDDQPLPDGGIVSYGIEITDRKRAEQEAREAAARLNLALDFSRVALWDHDLVDGRVFLSAQWAALRGLPAAETVTTRADMEALAHPDELATVRKTLGAVLSGAAPEFVLEHRIARVDGGWNWLLSRGRVSERDARGHALRMMGTSIDITGRVLAEQAAREAGARLKLALESSRVALWDTDLASGTIFFSEEWADIIGAPRAELRSTMAEQTRTVHPDDVGQLIAASRAAVKGETAEFSVELRTRALDGQWRWIYSRGRVVARDAAGRALRALGTIIDIGDRKAVENALLASEARFRSLVSLSNDVFWETDAAHRFVSQTYSRVSATRPPPEPEIGLTRWEVPYAAPDEATWRRHRADLEAHRTFRDFEIERPMPDGTTRVVQVSGEPVFDEAGRFTGYRGVGKDVTERRRAEDALRALNTELERRVAARTAALEAAYRELEAFSYSVSHDLRAPLRAIAGFANLIAEDEADRLSAEGRRLLGVIDQSAQKMGRLTDALLALARTSRQALDQRPVDMAALAGEVVAELAHEYPGARVELGFLPPALGDATLIRQVLVNLIGNALKYSGRVPEPTVRIRAEGDGPVQSYCVWDNGAGFDMAYADQLFKPFSRLHGEAAFPGAGIGLALAKLIVQRHGGRIWAESVPAGGTTFRFTLADGQPGSPG